MSRSRKIILIIGGTDVGKSTAAEAIALIRNKKFNEPVIIVSPNRQAKWLKYPEINLEQFKLMKKGVYRIHTGDFKLFFKIAYDHFGPGVIVAEDATGFLTPQPDREIYPMLVGLRHPDHDVDILGITHAVYRTPAYIIEQADEMILFKTGETWDKVQMRIPDHLKEEVKEAFIRVNGSPDQFARERIILKKKNVTA
jgi:hypothetical protein